MLFLCLSRFLLSDLKYNASFGFRYVMFYSKNLDAPRRHFALAGIVPNTPFEVSLVKQGKDEVHV